MTSELNEAGLDAVRDALWDGGHGLPFSKVDRYAQAAIRAYLSGAPAGVYLSAQSAEAEGLERHDFVVTGSVVSMRSYVFGEWVRFSAADARIKDLRDEISQVTWERNTYLNMHHDQKAKTAHWEAEARVAKTDIADTYLPRITALQAEVERLTKERDRPLAGILAARHRALMIETEREALAAAQTGDKARQSIASTESERHRAVYHAISLIIEDQHREF